MNTLAFDTHLFVKRMTAAGMPEAQAEVLADEQTNLIENNLATKRNLKDLEVALKRDLKDLEVALKRDLKDLEVALKRDLKELEARLVGQIRESEMRLIKWLIPLLLGQAALVAALVKLL